jgi:CubicO group peptidase (beta-lactamase class C family)
MEHAEIRDRLAASLERHHVPGGTVGLIRSGEVTVVAEGVARRDTMQRLESNTLFQMGSITKLYTATLVMQAVERNELSLDACVADVLPSFRPADGSFERITVLHLLTHSSGLPEAHQVDTGDGDDCLERYAHGLATLHLDFQPGERSTYSNANYVLLGRIIEVLSRSTWDEALRVRLLEPAQLLSTFTRPAQFAGMPTTLGYVPDQSGLPTIPAWGGPRCYAPAGSTPCTTMEDLLSFAAVHLAEGQARDGRLILSPATVAEMQEIRFGSIGYGAPEHLRPTGVGLGWLRFRHAGREWIGHDGGSAGQMTFLRVNAEDRMSFAVYVNAGTGFRVFEDVADEIAEGLSA